MIPNPHAITKIFEESLADYCGSKFCLCVDNESNALFLCLKYEQVTGMTIKIPSHTYPSVPCEILNNNAKVEFEDSPEILTGMYFLKPTRIIDSALFFNADMFVKNTLMCLSFTGSYKTLKLGKGGAILTDDANFVKWCKRARFSGRQEMSYHDDDFDFKGGVIGHNFYMNPLISALGLQMMPQFYNLDGSKKHNSPVSLKYPDLSKFKVFQND